MAFVVGDGNAARWVDSELDQFKSDGLQYYLRPLDQPTIRLVEQKAKQNPISRRHKLVDVDTSRTYTVEGNEVQAFGFELADYALRDMRQTAKDNVAVFIPNPDFNGEEAEDDDTNPRYVPATLDQTVIVREGQEEFEVTVKELVLLNIDVQNEIVRLARRIANKAEESSRKNGRR